MGLLQRQYGPSYLGCEETQRKRQSASAISCREEGCGEGRWKDLGISWRGKEGERNRQAYSMSRFTSQMAATVVTGPGQRQPGTLGGGDSST